MDLSDYLSPKERNNEAESMSENLQDNLWKLLNDPLYSFSQFKEMLLRRLRLRPEGRAILATQTLHIRGKDYERFYGHSDKD